MADLDPIPAELRREPPLNADVSLEGYSRIDLPFRWQGEEWFLELSDAALGCVIRGGLLAMKALLSAVHRAPVHQQIGLVVAIAGQRDAHHAEEVAA